MNSCERFWKMFVSLRRTPFPRELTTSRLVVHSISALIKLVRHINGTKDCFVSLYSLAQQELNEFDVLFFETDDLDTTLYIDDKLIKNHIHFVKFFSGKKGYHYYIPLVEINITNFSRVARKFLSMLEIDGYVDSHCTGDKNRLVRLPYTVHPETGFCSVYVEPLKTVGTNILNPTPPLEIRWRENRIVSAILAGLDVDDYRETKRSLTGLMKLEDYYPECILRLIDKAHETKYLTHEERLHLGAYLLKLMTIDEAVKFYECLEDFNERITRYHLEKMRDGFRCYTCNRAKSLGICPMKNPRSCIFYPSINLWLK